MSTRYCIPLLHWLLIELNKTQTASRKWTNYLLSFLLHPIPGSVLNTIVSFDSPMNWEKYSIPGIFDKLLIPMFLLIPKWIERNNIIPDQTVHLVLQTIAPLTPSWIEKGNDSSCKWTNYLLSFLLHPIPGSLINIIVPFDSPMNWEKYSI